MQIVESHAWFEILFWLVHVEAGCENIQGFFDGLENSL